MKPGTIDLPRRSIRCVFGPARRVMSALLPTATMREPRTATACATWKVSLTVMIFPLVRMRSAGGCCACSDNDSPTIPPNSSSQANFFITVLQAGRDPFFRCRDYIGGWPASPRSEDGSVEREGGLSCDACRKRPNAQCSMRNAQWEANRDSDACFGNFGCGVSRHADAGGKYSHSRPGLLCLDGHRLVAGGRPDGGRHRQREARGLD